MPLNETGEKMKVWNGESLMRGYEFDDDYPEVDLNPALEFVCGQGDVVPQIDNGVKGMKIGDRKFIQFDEDFPLFGFHDANKQISVPSSEYAGYAAGSVLSVKNVGSGLVVKETANQLVVDLNHPLAGKPVNITITLLASEEVPPKNVRIERLKPGDGLTYPTFGDWITLHLEVSIKTTGEVLTSTFGTDPLRYHLGFPDAEPKGRGFESGIQKVTGWCLLKMEEIRK